MSSRVRVISHFGVSKLLSPFCRTAPPLFLKSLHSTNKCFFISPGKFYGHRFLPRSASQLVDPQRVILNNPSCRYAQGGSFPSPDEKVDVGHIPSAAWRSMMHALSEELRHLREEISQVKEGHFSRRLSILILVALIGVFTSLILRWERVKQIVSDKGAEVISEGMQNKDLQCTAEVVGKILLGEILKDQDLRKKCVSFAAETLSKLGEEASALAVNVLKSPEVVGQASVTVGDIMTNLCESEALKKKLAEFIWAAVNTEEMQENGAIWFAKIFETQKVAAAFEQCAKDSTFEDPDFQKNAMEFMVASVVDAIDDPEVQKHASKLLWNVLKAAFIPWSRNTTSVREVALCQVSTNGGDHEGSALAKVDVGDQTNEQ